MSFEIVYHYYDKVEESYDKDNPQTMKKRLGKINEEIPLSKLYSAILTQRARRDILIYDMEVYEYQRQQIKIKETKNGFVIKGVKFSIGGDVDFDEDEEFEELAPHNNIIKKSNFSQKKPIKYVILDPDIMNLARIKGQNLKFSVDKEYGIYNEKPTNTIGISKYIIVDDLERDIEVSSEYFLPARIFYEKDIGRDSFGSKGIKKEPKLMFDGEIPGEVPNLR